MDLKKQEKQLDRKGVVDVGRLVSSRRLNVASDGHYAEGSTEIDDRPFTEGEKSGPGYRRAVKRQLVKRGPVTLQVPSTAIANARFDEDEGKIFVTYVGGDKEYVFKGDRRDWLAFMNSGSKGRYAQNVLRKKNQAPKEWYS